MRLRGLGLVVAGVISFVTVAACGMVGGHIPGSSSSRSGSATSSPSGSGSPSRDSSPSGTSSAHRSSSQDDSGPQLPRGGRTIFPKYRVVAYYGTAGTGSLGVLGSKPPGKIAPRIEKAAKPFAGDGRKVLPAMELIATVADSQPGPGHRYRHNITMSQARNYLTAARAHHQLLILDIQPGHGDFLPAVKHWSKLLREPDVGLALDSEWHMHGNDVPGQVIGHSKPEDINPVSNWLARMTVRHHLPQKLFVLHQFTKPMLSHPEQIKTRHNLATVQHLDGFGARKHKLAKYKHLQRPKQFHMGFKLFYKQDDNMMPPKRALKLDPTPEYLSYQ